MQLTTMASCQDIIVKTGRDIDFRWREDEDGTIHIAIKTGSDAGVVQQEHTGQPSKWTCSAERGNNGTAIRLSNTIPTVSIPLAATQSLDDKLQKLQRLVEHRKNRGQKLEKLIPQWLEDPQRFLGCQSPLSSEKVSYQSLKESEDGIHIYRNVFFRAHLASFEDSQFNLAKSREPSYDLRNCRRGILTDLHPGYTELHSKERKLVTQNYRRYVDQGGVIRKLSLGHEGILLTICPFLRTSEYTTISEIDCFC